MGYRKSRNVEKIVKGLTEITWTNKIKSMRLCNVLIASTAHGYLLINTRIIYILGPVLNNCLLTSFSPYCTFI